MFCFKGGIYMKIRKITFTLVILGIFLSLFSEAFALTKSENFIVSIKPNFYESGIERQSESLTSELNMEIILSDYTFANPTVESTINVSWADKQWQTTLEGLAYIYNDSTSGPIVVGSVSGFNGEIAIDRFIGIDYTYNVSSGNCIATASYNYASNGNCEITTFGNNTGEFDEAILSVSMQAARNVEDDVILTPPISATSIDTSSKFIGQHNLLNGVVYFEAWAQKEMMPSGTNFLAARIKGSVSKATPYILEQEDSAMYISPTDCEVYFVGDENFNFYNNEMCPSKKSEEFTISIPLPLGQSVDVAITVSSIDTGLSNGKKTTYWKLYDIMKIEELDNSNGIGFENKFLYNGNTIPDGESQRMNIQCTGSIGYHYAYIDETGHNNSATWYPMAIVSGYVDCVN